LLSRDWRRQTFGAQYNLDEDDLCSPIHPSVHKSRPKDQLGLLLIPSPLSLFPHPPLHSPHLPCPARVSPPLLHYPFQYIQYRTVPQSHVKPPKRHAPAPVNRGAGPVQHCRRERGVPAAEAKDPSVQVLQQTLQVSSNTSTSSLHIGLHCPWILGVWSMFRDTRERIPRKSPFPAVGSDVGKRLDVGKLVYFVSITVVYGVGGEGELGHASAIHYLPTASPLLLSPAPYLPASLPLQHSSPTALHHLKSRPTPP